MKRKIARTERHIRWNWENSPDESEMVRYHFIIIDDKNRRATLAQLVAEIA